MSGSFADRAAPDVIEYTAPACAYMTRKCSKLGCPLPHLPGLGRQSFCPAAAIVPAGVTDYYSAPPFSVAPPKTFLHVPEGSPDRAHVEVLSREEHCIRFPFPYSEHKQFKDVCSICGACSSS